MKNKTKILLAPLILVLAAGIYFVSQHKNKTELFLVSGEVTKIEGDKIYFRTTTLVTAEGQQVQVVKKDETALILPTTEFMLRDPFMGLDAILSFEDIKVGSGVAVYYSKINRQKEYIALRVGPTLSGEKYRVDNLIKYLNQ